MTSFVESVAFERRIVGDVFTSPALWDSVRYLCDTCNGRFAGTDDERRAGDFLLRQFREIGLENVGGESFEMAGWRRDEAHCVLVNETNEQKTRNLPCLALPGSPAGDCEADVVDVGPGTAADFDGLEEDVSGKIVLADSRGPHRKEKYVRACEHGAVGFLFANAKPGMLMPTGSISPAPIPGVGIASETAALIRRWRQGNEQRARVRLKTVGGPEDVVARNVIAEMPGTDSATGWIVVCAHYDGHDIAQGAQDNATGTALVLETARLLAPLRSHLKASLRFILFSGEEFGLHGSHAYVDEHDGDLHKIRAVFNADIVGLAAPLRLTAQNMPELASYLRRLVPDELGAEVRDMELMPHSDHYPFVLAGVPSLAITSSPPTTGSWAHTVADTVDKLDQQELRGAAATAARILLRMAMLPDGLPRGRQSPQEVQQILAEAGVEQSLDS